MTEDEAILARTLQGFRARSVEPVWEELNKPNPERYQTLWGELRATGMTELGLDLATGEFELSGRSIQSVIADVGAACPALAAGVISHVTSILRLLEAGATHLPDGASLATDERSFAWIGRPAAGSDSPFELHSNGKLTLRGERRVILPRAEWLVVPAYESDSLVWVVLRRDQLRFDAQTSAHGLRFLPVGKLVAHEVEIQRSQVFRAPTKTRADAVADGLICALFGGMLREMASRATQYAVQRYQGGKMIHRHDAIQQLIGPILLYERAARVLAVDTLSDPWAHPDSAACSLIAPLARKAGLSAIQVFGGYGYMEDYRVERYFRDANTLETSWIHAASAERRVAAAACNSLEGA